MEECADEAIAAEGLRVEVGRVVGLADAIAVHAGK
jgi:hypothetical protein